MNMNQTDQTVFNAFLSRFSKIVNPIVITNELYQTGLFSQLQRDNIHTISQESDDQTSVWDTLSLLIPLKCNRQQFISVLHRAGYIDLVSHIHDSVCNHSVEPLQLVQRTNCESSQRYAQRLFMNFKINTHNNTFVDPRKYCHEASVRYRIQLNMLTERHNIKDNEFNEVKSRCIADKLTACILGEIDSYTMLYERKFPAEELFDKLKEMISQTSNSNVTELSYHSRLAIAYAVAGNRDKGEEHIREASKLATLVGRCVEIPNLLYIHAFHLLCAYEKAPTEGSRDKCLYISELGLQSVEDEEESIREFWRRIFFMRMIYCLLGLSFRGDPIQYIYVDRNSVIRAKEVMIEVEKLWNRMETRRKIMYFVGKARIVELEHNDDYINKSLYFLNKAIKIGNDGKYGEIQFIKQYAEKLKTENVVRKDGTTTLSSKEINTKSSPPNEGDQTSLNHEVTEKASVSCLYDFSDTEHLSLPSLPEFSDTEQSLDNESYSIQCRRVDNMLPNVNKETQIFAENKNVNISEYIHLDIESLQMNTSSSDMETLSITCNDSRGNPRNKIITTTDAAVKLHEIMPPKTK